MRLAYRAKKQIRALLESCESRGPRTSARRSSQWEAIEIKCLNCVRNLQRRAASRRVARKKRGELRVLEQVHVEIVKPRRVPSARYRGERGNDAGGGNFNIAIFAEMKYHRVFLAFINRKNDLEAAVREMRRHIHRDGGQGVC